MTPETLQSVLAERLTGRTVVLATRLPDGKQWVLPDLAAPLAVSKAAELAIEHDKSSSRKIADETWFFHVYAPPYRLIIIGAVHIAQALAPLARSLGYAVIVVDPRRAFNSVERFADVERVHDWPDVAISQLRPDARSAVVALTHDPKLDDPALDNALRSTTSYIGALGSRRSQTARLSRLAALGHGPETLARIRGPVGLPIGAISATEIALSIIAEIVAVRRGSTLALR